MTNGTSQGLFIVVAIVIFGIFVGMSYTLFGDEMAPALVDLFGDSTEQADAILKGTVIDENNNGEVDLEDTVNIKDSALKTEIVKQLETDGVEVNPDKVTVENIKKLESLTAVNKKVSKLDGLEQATNLKSLDVSNNAIKTVEPITKLTDLVYLNVEGNPISDFKKLDKMNIPTLKNVKETIEGAFVFDIPTQTITDYVGTDANVIIPEKINGLDVLNIGKYAFNRYSEVSGNKIDVNLESVVIPDTVVKIGDYAFTGDARNVNNRHLTSIHIGNSVTEIGSNAFQRTLLTEVTLPDSIKTIGEYAFDNVNLTHLDLGEGVEKISRYAFSGSYTELTIPRSLKSVDNLAFILNADLENVYAYDVNTSPLGKNPNASPRSIFNHRVKVYYEQPYLFNASTQTITDYWGYEQEIVIPSEINGMEVKHIGSYAFSRYTNGYNNKIFVPITSVTFPDTLETIKDYAFRNDVSTVTEDKLQKVVLGSSLTSIGVSAFENNNLEKLTIPDSVTNVSEKAFSKSNNLKELHIGKGLSRINKESFTYILMDELYIPENVTSITNYAFMGSKITSLKIDNSKSNVTFGDYAVKLGFQPTYLK